MVLAAIAIICIILIGSIDPNAILRALLLVAIVKFTMSPQTPLTAYIAVGFQGLTGFLILRPKFLFLLKCIIFGALAMIQTSLQKAIVLTIVFGSQFWNAINKLIDSLLKDFGIKDYNYSYIVLSIYVGIHVIAGIIAGIYAYRFSKKLKLTTKNGAQEPNILSENKIAGFLQKKKKKHFGMIPVILGLFAILYALKYLNLFESYPLQSEILNVVVRGALILLIWNFFFSPLFTSFMFKWLTKKRSALKDELAVLLTFTPEIKEIVSKSWSDSKGKNIFARVFYFIGTSFENFLIGEI